MVLPMICAGSEAARFLGAPCFASLETEWISCCRTGWFWDRQDQVCCRWMTPTGKCARRLFAVWVFLPHVAEKELFGVQLGSLGVRDQNS